MKKLLVLAAILTAPFLFGADVDITKTDNTTNVTFNKAFPTNAGLPVGALQAQSSLSVGGVSTSIGTVPTGATKVAVYSTSALNYNEGSAAAVAGASGFSVATTTLTFFHGPKTALEGLTFILKDGLTTATVALRYY